MCIRDRYEVALQVANPAGAVTRRAIVTVLSAPVASFLPDDDAPAIDQPVTFVNTSGGQPPLTVFWDFGDGTTLMGEQQPAHVYRQGGVYRVRLTVENSVGRSEAVWDVTVGEPPLATEMVIDAQTSVGQDVTGQASAADSGTRFLWDMGDGRQHEGAGISHRYRRPGDYYVTLLADNGFGQAQQGQWVHVDAGVTTLFLPLATHQLGSPLSGLRADAPAAADLDPVGASDRDLDGVADVCDVCPDDPEKIVFGLCGCGVVDDPLAGDSARSPDSAGRRGTHGPGGTGGGDRA